MPNHRRRARLLLPAAAVLLLAGCADGDGEGDVAADGDGGGDVEVGIADFAYDPDVVTVSAGDTVTWVNDDGVGHTVTAGEPGAPDDAFDEQVGPSGGTASITFDEAGTVAYFCTVHPNMTGEVVVE